MHNLFILCFYIVLFLFFAAFYVIGPATPPPGLSERPCGTPKPVSAPTETTWPTGPDTRNLLSFKPREQCNGALQEIQRPDVALICLWREVGRKASGAVTRLGAGCPGGGTTEHHLGEGDPRGCQVLVWTHPIPIQRAHQQQTQQAGGTLLKALLMEEMRYSESPSPRTLLWKLKPWGKGWGDDVH